MNYTFLQELRKNLMNETLESFDRSAYDGPTVPLQRDASQLDNTALKNGLAEH